MSQYGLFSRRYDIGPEMLLDFLQQAMASLPTITSYQLADSGDRINFTTSFTWTSWGEKMLAAVESEGPEGAVVTVSGEPRVESMSTRWGEEMHAATIESQLFTALDSIIQTARTNPILMLQADHRRVEVLFAAIQATDDGERAGLVRQLLLALRVHMELEENHVYPLLGQEVDADTAEEAEVEHQLARDGLAQLEEFTPDEPGFDAALVMVMAGIEHHVMEEETEAFPRLASRLGPDRLAELAEQLTAVRADVLKQAQADAKAGSKQDKPEAKAPRAPRPKRASDRTRPPRSKRKSEKIDPGETTKANLLQRAKKAGVSGYSHMSKAELAEAIERVQ